MPSTKATSRPDLHAEITGSIIEAIETGQASGKQWAPPWQSITATGLPENAVTGHRYRGVNILQLWGQCERRGYVAPLWATFKQWKSVGASVRKGEKGTRIVFYKQLKIRDENAAEGEISSADRVIPMLRYSTVFNAEQVDGFELPECPPVPDVAERIGELDSFLAATGAEIRTNGGRAYYNRDGDYIGMPERELFFSTAGYYSTAFHELTHWTGHRSRCDRTFGKRFGDAQYAAEELVAELGAAFLCGSLAVESEPREDHAHYIESWIRLLRSDSKAIFTAAARASDAVEYLEASARDAAPVIPPVAA